MMFMRAILALSLAAFALAVPVADPQLSEALEKAGVYQFCSSNTHRYSTNLMIECRRKCRHPS
jgi:hypothetical protein